MLTAVGWYFELFFLVFFKMANMNVFEPQASEALRPGANNRDTT